MVQIKALDLYPRAANMWKLSYLAYVLLAFGQYLYSTSSLSILAYEPHGITGDLESGMEN